MTGSRNSTLAEVDPVIAGAIDNEVEDLTARFPLYPRRLKRSASPA